MTEGFELIQHPDSTSACTQMSGRVVLGAFATVTAKRLTSVGHAHTGTSQLQSVPIAIQDGSLCNKVLQHRS